MTDSRESEHASIVPRHDEQTVIPLIDRPHPRLFLTPARIASIKAAIEEERQPVYDTWQALRARAEELLREPPAAHPYVGHDSRVFYDACLHDASIARDLALAYTFTGDERFAERALELLRAWVEARPLPGSRFDPGTHYPGTGMWVVRSIFSFVWTYDLLYPYTGFDEILKEETRLWFSLARQIIETGALRWKANNYFDQQLFNNHLISDAMGLVMIGYALGDRDLVQFAVDHPLNSRDFKALIAGVILMPDDEPYYREPGNFPIQAGEIYDRYRHFEFGGHFGNYVTKPNCGLLYATHCLDLMAITADLLKNNGVDFFRYTAPGGENLELPFDFYADFYRLMDASIKGGFYDGETERIPDRNNGPGVFEVGAFHYPENGTIKEMLSSKARAEQRTSFLGWPALLYGAEE